jgi:hypothetical protein
MKLSEAIREGAKLRPQSMSGLHGDNGALCALGLAYLAKTGYSPEVSTSYVCDLLFDGEEPTVKAKLPDDRISKLYGLGDFIFYLNDNYKWPAAAIADEIENLAY